MYISTNPDGHFQCSLQTLAGTPRIFTASSLEELNQAIEAFMCHEVRSTVAYRAREGQFLATWKLGVALAGAHYFDVRAPSIEAATDKNQLRPAADLEDRAATTHRGKQALLGAMLSIYNSHRGQRYLEEIGYPNLCDLAAKLDPLYAEIVIGLIRHYQGW